MSLMAFLVFKQLVEMLLIMAISFGVSKIRHYGDKEAQYLSFILLYVIAPAVVIEPYNIPFDAQRFHETLVMLGFSFAGLSVLIILSLFIPKKNVDYSLLAIDKMGTVYSNCGYIGIPIVQAAMGKAATFYIVPYLLVFNTIFWIHGQYVMTRRLSFKAVVTKPMFLGTVFAFLLFLSPWTLPRFLGEAVSTLGTLNMPLSMFLLGILFANFGKTQDSSSFPIGRMVRVFILRLIVSPLLIILCFMPLRTIINADALIKTLSIILVIVSACPCGVNISTMAVLYKKNFSYASVLIVGTTILSVGTIPIMTRLAETVL